MRSIIRLGLFATVAFILLVIYNYKSSRRFRQSIIFAYAVIGTYFGGPEIVEEANAKGFGPPLPQRPERVRPTERGGIFGSNPDKPEGGDDSDDETDGENTSYPKLESVEQTEEWLRQIEENNLKMKEISDDDSESDSSSDSDSSSEIEDQCKNDVRPKTVLKKKDINRCMSQDDLEGNESSADDLAAAKAKKEKEILWRLKNSVESNTYYKEYRNRPARITIHTNTDGIKHDPIVTIIDSESGKFIVDTPITKAELEQLKDLSSNKFKLSDRRRDGQTGIINKKSLKEEETLQAYCEQENKNSANYERPSYNKGGDYYEKTRQREIEIKDVQAKGGKTFADSSNDIVQSIKDYIDGTPINKRNREYVIGLLEVPNNMKSEIEQQIRTDLGDYFKEIDITFVKTKKK